MKYTTNYKSTVYGVGKRFNTNSFGEVEILGKIYRKGKDPHYAVRFINTGTVAATEGGNIKRGNIKDWYAPFCHGVGYLGVGQHRSGFKGKATKEYTLWNGMLARVYSGRDKWESYKDVTVCERWLCFQNFCDDLPKIPNYSKWVKGGYSIDKDESGARVYSLDTCKFVTVSANSKERQERLGTRITERDTKGRIVKSCTAK